MKLVTVAEMRAIEAEANEKGLSYAEMMQRAGTGVAEVVLDLFEDTTGLAVALVGPGNNGGDALVALTVLAEEGWDVRAYLVKDRGEQDPLIRALLNAGGQIVKGSDDAGFETLSELLEQAEVLLDGVLGTGIELPLRPEIARVLAAVKDQEFLPTVVAIDCPSGVNSDTGEAAPETIPADLTVCTAAVKTGLLKFPAYELAGNLAVVDLGFPDGLQAFEAVSPYVITGDYVASVLPERPIDAHKGSFGTALMAVGSLNYTGAVMLAAEAAYRSGAGLVQVAVPGPLHPALAGQIPEATWVLLPHELGVIAENAAAVLMKNLDRATALLVGCGWGQEDTTTDFLTRLLSGQNLQKARGPIGFISRQNEDENLEVRIPPLVVDADGLRHLVKLENWPQRLPEMSILTPHPGEMAVLTGWTIEEIQADRLAAAREFAAAWRHVVVLKGAITVVAEPSGRVGVIPVATPALARAGTGDVLAGLIVGLRAQGLSAFDAAAAGAWIHAMAGLNALEISGASASVLARDVLLSIPDVLSELE